MFVFLKTGYRSGVLLAESVCGEDKTFAFTKSFSKKRERLLTDFYTGKRILLYAVRMRKGKKDLFTENIFNVSSKGFLSFLYKRRGVSFLIESVCGEDKTFAFGCLGTKTMVQ